MNIGRRAAISGAVKASSRRWLAWLVLAAMVLSAAPSSGDEGGAGVSQGKEYKRHDQYVKWSD